MKIFSITVMTTDEHIKEPSEIMEIIDNTEFEGGLKLKAGMCHIADIGDNGYLCKDDPGMMYRLFCMFAK